MDHAWGAASVIQLRHAVMTERKRTRRGELNVCQERGLALLVDWAQSATSISQNSKRKAEDGGVRLLHSTRLARTMKEETASWEGKKEGGSPTKERKLHQPVRPEASRAPVTVIRRLRGVGGGGEGVTLRACRR